MVICTCNASRWETEAGGSGVANNIGRHKQSKKGRNREQGVLTWGFEIEGALCPAEGNEGAWRGPSKLEGPRKEYQ